MLRRWVAALLLLAVVVFISAPVLGHKMPIVEYTYVGHIWEEAYHTNPRQPVTDDHIVFQLSVKHPNETIEGNVSGVIAIYQDDTEYKWYGGKSYKDPDWQLIKDASLAPTEGENAFVQDVVIDLEGSYKVFIDWYEDRQYIGQSMHTLDIESRTIGPLFIIFNIVLIAGITLGVRRGIL